MGIHDQPETVRVPKQARSRERVAQILQAARALIRENGSANLTILAIKKRAGVTGSSIYQYFPNKSAIMVELCQQYLDQIGEIIDRNMSQTPTSIEEFQALILKIFDEYLGLHVEDPVLQDILHSMGSDKDLDDMDQCDTEKNVQKIFETVRYLFNKEDEEELLRWLSIAMTLARSIVVLALRTDPNKRDDVVRTAKSMISVSLAVNFRPRKPV